MTAPDHKDCEQIGDLLDFYIDNELPAAETTLVGAHLSGCASCREEMESRIAMRERLRGAVRSTPVPARLTGKEFVNLAVGKAPVYRRPAWIAAAAAAILAVTTAGYEVGHLRNTVATQDEYIAKISDETAPIIRVGLKDHIHCAVFRKYAPEPAPIEEMTLKLGAEYADLIPALQAQAPPEMKIAIAHKCRYKGRQYLHLVARGGDHLISLVIADRGEGEAFESDIKAVVNGAGGQFYSAGVREFAIAGFETGQHLVYLVSDFDQTRNLHMMTALSPQIRRLIS